MIGRRYSDGLHQAIEAKENVTVRNENKTHATITFQNYFRLYDKLSGMTGTAKTEEEEFRTIYGLDVLEIPTNRPLQRKDNPDVIYSTEKGKIRAIIQDIIDTHAKGQPILVGTISVESNTTWTVSKSNPEEEGWFQINGDSSFEGNADLSIIVSEYSL